MSSVKKALTGLAFLALGGCAEPGGQSALYIPSLVVYEPAPRALAECGRLVMGLDPRWEFTQEVEPDGRNGRPRIEYRSRYGRETAMRLTATPLAEVALAPSQTISIFCESDPAPAGEAARVADLIASRQTPGNGDSAVRRAQLNTPAGPWETVSNRTETEDGLEFTVARYLQQRDGQLITIRVFAYARPAVRVGGVVFRNDEVVVPRPDGSELRGRVRTTTLRGPAGTLLFARSPAQSRAFIQQVEAGINQTGS